MPQPPIRDEFRQAQRDALDAHIGRQSGPEPTPDGDSARKNAMDRAQSSSRSAPDGPDMASQQAWANEYDKVAQDRQAEIHGRQQGQSPQAPDRDDAKQALADHEAGQGQSKEKTLDAGSEIDGSRSGRNDLKAEHAAARDALDRHEQAGPDQGKDNSLDQGVKIDDPNDINR